MRSLNQLWVNRTRPSEESQSEALQNVTRWTFDPSTVLRLITFWTFDAIYLNSVSKPSWGCAAPANRNIIIFRFDLLEFQEHPIEDPNVMILIPVL